MYFYLEFVLFLLTKRKERGSAILKTVRNIWRVNLGGMESFPFGFNEIKEYKTSTKRRLSRLVTNNGIRILRIPFLDLIHGGISRLNC